MTVSNTAFQTPATGDGATTAFPFTWRIVDDASVAVYVAQAKKTLGADYTLSTNRTSTGLGGTVTFNVAPANGAAIIIQREDDQLQANPLQDNQALSPATLQMCVDKLTLLVQAALRSYTSSDQALTAGSLTTLAHGLGKIPTRTRTYLVCQTTDAGYAVGDVIEVGMTSIGTLQVDMTNIYLRTFSAFGSIAVANKSTFASANLTLANWKLRILAS